MSKTRFSCPICRKKVEKSSENFPFCSERCRLTDLGRWATGDYRIPGEPANIPLQPDDEE